MRLVNSPTPTKTPGGIVTRGGSLGNINQSNAPMALNANTTYGVDVSMQNNYGVGTGYVTPTIAKTQALRKKAEPSAWWLAGFLLLLAVL